MAIAHLETVVELLDRAEIKQFHEDIAKQQQLLLSISRKSPTISLQILGLAICYIITSQLCSFQPTALILLSIFLPSLLQSVAIFKLNISTANSQSFNT